MKHTAVGSEALEIFDFDCLSIDFFDTLFYRRNLKSYESLFQYYHSFAKTFEELKWLVEMRRRAEYSARALALTSGKGEIHLDDIYNYLSSKLNLHRELADRLKQAEIEHERVELVPNLRLISYLRDVKKKGKNIVVVSDYYIGREHLSAVLERHGLGDIVSNIYVSCDHGCTKADGGLIDVFLKDAGYPPSSVVHIGDNLHSDVRSFLAKGVRAIRVINFEQHDKSVLSLIPTRVRLEGGIQQAAFKNWINESQDSLRAKFGRYFLGPLYLALARYCSDEIGRGVLTGVFCARDMQIIYRILSKYSDKSRSVSYFHVSRNALYRILPAIEPSLALEKFLQNYSNVTVFQALQRIGIGPGQLQKKFGIERYEKVHALLSSTSLEKDQKTFKALYTEFLPALVQYGNEQGELLAMYLAGLNKSKSGLLKIFDLGWHGSISELLNIILANRPVKNLKVVGASYLHIFDERRSALALETSTFFSEVANADLIVKQSPSLIEALFAADHETVVGYKKSARSVSALQATGDFETKQHKEWFAPMQEAALEYIASLVQKHGATIESIPEREIASAGECALMLEALIQRADHEVVSLFSQYEFFPDFGNSGNLQGLTSFNPQSNVRELWSHGRRQMAVPPGGFNESQQASKFKIDPRKVRDRGYISVYEYMKNANLVVK